MANTGRNSGEDSNREARGIIGALFAAAGVVIALAGIAIAIFSAGVAVAIEFVGIVFGIVGYSLGARRLATIAIVLCLVSMFLGLAASQGLIPGIGGFDPRR